jgi:glutamate N-acetyltransferase/amino-acid N-acetyltransferase
MIRPDMATMLAFVATDAALDGGLLQDCLNRAVADSFNRITVDGDTSTNDACVLVATGRSTLPRDAAGHLNGSRPPLPMSGRAGPPSCAMARGNKFVTIAVDQGATSEECRSSYTIAFSW